MSEIEHRKLEHLDIVMRGRAGPAKRGTGLDQVQFQHCALPEMQLGDVTLETRFLGKTLRAPLLVSSMTGGPGKAGMLNLAIAEVCDQLGLAFGVGSQRIALEGQGAGGLGAELRRAAPKTLILANFGAAQLQEWDGADMARRAVDMIGADALVIHLNPLQEAVQHDGDTNWSGLLAALGKLCASVSFPVICKEVGAGISGAVARQLVDAGVSAIDVAGQGGTSWAAVEGERAPTQRQRQIAEAFRDWGIPTARAIGQVRRACPDIPVIASGGLRDGIDCARGLRLGADIAAMAGPLLHTAVKGPEALAEQLEIVIEQLRIVCFCTGSRTLRDLKRAPLLESDP